MLDLFCFIVKQIIVNVMFWQKPRRMPLPFACPLDVYHKWNVLTGMVSRYFSLGDQLWWRECESFITFCDWKWRTTETSYGGCQHDTGMKKSLWSNHCLLNVIWESNLLSWNSILNSWFVYLYNNCITGTVHRI